MEEWTLSDVHDLRKHWREFGPPTHIAVALFASSWGVKLTSDEPDDPSASPADEDSPPVTGPTIAEIAAAVTMPRSGADTLDASREIARLLAHG